MAKKAKKSDVKIGRPSNFNENIAHVVIALFKEGKTEEQVSQMLGIHIGTLRNWKNSDPDFLNATKDAKRSADDLVEAALFTRAVGYSHKEVKIMSYEGHSFEHEYIKQVEPDSAAAQFWLRNRQPEKWRDKQEIDVKGEGIKIVIDKDDEKL